MNYSIGKTSDYNASDYNALNYIYFLVMTLLFTIMFNDTWRYTGVLRWGCLALFVFMFLITYKAKFTFDPIYTLWSLGFIFFGLLSVLWAESTSNVISVSMTMLSNAFVLMIIRSSIKTKKDIEMVILAFIVSCLINAVYLYLYSLESLLELNQQEGYLYRLGMNIDGEWNANSVGMMMSMSAVSIMYFFKKTKSKIVQAILIGMSVFFVALALLSGSRKALLMIMMGVFLYLILTSKGKIVRNVLIIVAITYILIYAVYNIPFFYKTIGYRMEGLLSFISGSGTVDNSTLVRDRFISASIDVFKQFPILGCGLNCFSVLNVGITGYEVYSHNNFTEILSCLGIVGFAIYHSGYVYAISNLFKYRKNNSLVPLLFTNLAITLILSYAFVCYYDMIFNLITMIGFALISLEKDDLVLVKQQKN